MLDNTFVCSSDNYFPKNVFVRESVYSYYSALYAEGKTEEYCLTVDSNDFISNVHIGGFDAWYMVGHAFFTHEFSEAFRKIMLDEYDHEDTKQGYWEDVYIRNISQLPSMKINRYKDGEILEFDSLDELRMFDKTYCNNTRSSVVKHISKHLGVPESNVYGFKNIKHPGNYLMFQFMVGDRTYVYNAGNNIVEIKQL